jgi:hypothetical protein
MVVGPEFGSLVALCIGIMTRGRQPATRALGTLVLGFAVGIAATVILTWILTAAGLLNESMLIAERPLTSFIWKPDALVSSPESQACSRLPPPSPALWWAI